MKKTHAGLPASPLLHRLVVLSLCLLASTAVHPGAERTEAPSPEPAAAGPIRAALREHGWHLAAALGAELLTHEYHKAYGASTDPLFFSTPGELDTRLRGEISGSRSNNTIWDNGVEVLKFGAPLAMVALNFDDGGLVSRDLIGFTEALFAKRAATRLLKDLVGRERPRLEFAEEDGLGPGAIEELEEKSGSHRSFPSGHASGAFTFAAYLERVVAREVGLDSRWRKASFVSLYGLAGWIGYGRLRVDKHYLSDVAAGAALGTWIARRAYRHTHPEEFEGRRTSGGHGASRLTIHPPSYLAGGGVALTVGIRLGAQAR